MMNITPDRIYEAVAQTIKGQDEYVKTLATLAWLQMLRYKNRKVNNRADGKINALVIGASGTGKTATADQAEEVCKEIRDYIRSLYDDETADAVRIQYGGSVKSENAREILGEPNIDGALVGGASLVVDEFIDIIKAANEVSA